MAGGRFPINARDTHVICALIGFKSHLVNLASGEGLMNHLFRERASFNGVVGRNRGVMVSMETGTSAAMH